MAHQNWTNVSFVSSVSVFVSWQCLYLTDPNTPSRFAFVFIKARLRYFLPVWLAAIYAKLQIHNRVPLSIPSRWLFVILLIQLRRTKCGIRYFRGASFSSPHNPFYSSQFHALWNFSSHKLINQVETLGLPLLEIKWPTFSTKKLHPDVSGEGGEKKKKKAAPQARALVFSSSGPRFIFGLLFNEINPLLTVTWDERKRHKAGEGSGKVLRCPTYPPTHPV